MKIENQDNTLFLGNGFSMTVFKDIPSWDGLFEGADSKIKNNTIRYEAYRLLKSNAKIVEDVLKQNIIKKINIQLSEENLNRHVSDLESFGTCLKQNNINNIITTNYDTGIEFILCKCGYIEEKSNTLSPETVYSIRTYKSFYNNRISHQVKLWKIHGDINRPASITLGFDQYCGSLSKLNAYVKGSYRSSQKKNTVVCTTHMTQKCNTNCFDHLSWAELFFRTNVYIVGFGMDFSEIDIWWLINKRARFKSEGVAIHNKITYLHNPAYDDNKMPAILVALDAFDVTTRTINSTNTYINEIFKSITTLIPSRSR